jgi:23S rRNA pseudouridine2605 synthase
MRVDLGGLNAGMSEKLLQHSQIGASGVHVGRKGMPQHVRRNPVRAGQSCRDGGLLDLEEGGLSGQSLRRVCVDGRVARNATTRVDPGRARITVDGESVAAERKVYLMLNKPRGLVTTRDDPHERATVYDCLEGIDLPFVAPVGRLDKASEGLLLMTNDTRWAQRVLDPASNVEKVYHVRIDRMPDETMLERLEAGMVLDGERLAVKSARALRSGTRNAWLEVVLSEGRNRQIRRLLGAVAANVLRLVRIDVGGVRLGDLPRGAIRHLTPAEKAMLDVPLRPSRRRSE